MVGDDVVLADTRNAHEFSEIFTHAHSDNDRPAVFGSRRPKRKLQNMIIIPPLVIRGLAPLPCPCIRSLEKKAMGLYP